MSKQLISNSAVLPRMTWSDVEITLLEDSSTTAKDHARNKEITSI